MITIDTNILVHFLINDHEKQHQTAKQLFQDHHIYLSKTVLLETEWVLRGKFAFPRIMIARALQKAVMLSTVTCEDSNTVLQALDLCMAGMDFADALHLMHTSKNSVFATFDKKLATKAKKANIAVRLLL